MKRGISILLCLACCLSLFQVVPDKVSASSGQKNQSSNPLSNLSPASTAITSLSVSTEWKYGILGNGIGSEALYADDIDHDGKIELVVSANLTISPVGSNYWYVLRQSGPNQYDQIWFSPRYIGTSEITKISVAHINNDPIADIFVVTQRNTVSVQLSRQKCHLLS